MLLYTPTWPLFLQIYDILKNQLKMVNTYRIEFKPGREHDVSVGVQHALIPLKSDKTARKLYVSGNDGGVRFGTILKELDCLASMWSLHLAS